MYLSLTFVVFLCLLSRNVDGFAKWMLKDFCTRELHVGEIIMGDEVIMSQSRHILVHKHAYNERGDKVLLPLEGLQQNNGTYTMEDELQVSLNDTRGQFVFEIQSNSASGAQFVDGGCTAKHRQDKQHSTLVLPRDGSDIVLVVAWATGHVQVAVSSPIHIKYNGPPLPAATQQRQGTGGLDINLLRGIPTLASLKAPSLPSGSTAVGTESMFGIEGAYAWVLLIGGVVVVLYGVYNFIFKKSQYKKP